MSEILGNLKGIRNSVIEELKTLYDMKLSSGQLLSAELALKLADITDFINREISVYITRSVKDLHLIRKTAYRTDRGIRLIGFVRRIKVFTDGNIKDNEYE